MPMYDCFLRSRDARVARGCSLSLVNFKKCVNADIFVVREARQNFKDSKLE